MRCLIIFVLLSAVSEARQRLQASLVPNYLIIDGTPAAITDYPSQASLRYSGTHTCGCVHLSTSRVLTTAHCVDGRTASAFDVYYGSSSHNSGGTLASASAYFMHPDYDPGARGFPNDIATVAASITFDGVTAVAANLPSGALDFGGSTCTITGWGKTSAADELSDELQQVSLPVLANPDCSSLMSSITGASIDDWHICIHDSIDISSGSCQGDNGGPMYCTEGETTVLAGLMSWGISLAGECLLDYPSVYTRVSYFLTWIP